MRTVRWMSLVVLASWPLAARAEPEAAPVVDPRVAELVESVSAERLGALLERLVSFETRHTLSGVDSTARGIGAAREWIRAELERSSPELEVRLDRYRLAPQRRIPHEVEIANVIAVLPGRSERRVYVSAHYDSLNLESSDPDVLAPGANDDGSGTVIAMELARVLAGSDLDLDATLVFALWAGEEQGLYGSAAHAQRLAREGVPVEAVLNSDIVGNVRGGDGRVDGGSVRLFSRGPADSMSRSLARYVERVAGLYVPGHRIRLVAREDRFGRGGDQMSFGSEGFPAVVFREARESFARQHSAADTLDGVDLAYLTRNARASLAAAVSLALAPPAPHVSGENGRPMLGRGASGYDAELRWSASPGAVGYRVYWRDGWANDWQRSRSVGAVTELTLEGLCIDDHVFGVAAVGPGGHESLVRAYVVPPAAIPAVELAPATTEAQ